MKIKELIEQTKITLQRNLNQNPHFQISFYIEQYATLHKPRINISVLSEDERVKNFFQRSFKTKRAALEALKECFVVQPETETKRTKTTAEEIGKVYQ